MKNTLYEIHIRLFTREIKTIEIEYIVIETFQNEVQKEER